MTVAVRERSPWEDRVVSSFEQSRYDRRAVSKEKLINSKLFEERNIIYLFYIHSDPVEFT